jgi:cob(I)alamin adenosyltransferase
MTRITSARTRKGDTGESEVLEGKVVPKSNPILILQSQAQIIMVWSARLIIKYGNLLDDIDLKLLQEIKSVESNNLGASIYKGLVPDALFLPVAFREKVETRIVDIRDLIPNAPEFIICSTLMQCDFMEMNLQVRILEHYLWKMVDSLFFSPKNQPSETAVITSTYNALSDYVYQLMRYLTYKTNTTETTWINPTTTNK